MKEITPQHANEVLHHFGHGGWTPGSFAAALIDAMAKADASNLARLRIVYPGYAAAVDLVQHTPDGVDKVRAIAGGMWT